MKLGQQENALDALRNATEIDPGAAAAWGMLARVIIEDLPSPTPEELEEAHEAAQIAVDIRADPEYLDALGWAHHRVDQDEEALAILLDAKEAIMLVGKDHSTWEAIHYHLAEVYLKMEDFDKAKDEYESVVDFFKKYKGTNRRYIDASEARLDELKELRRRQ